MFRNRKKCSLYLLFNMAGRKGLGVGGEDIKHNTNAYKIGMLINMGGANKGNEM